MKTLLILDPTGVAPKNHETFIEHAKDLGYVPVEGCEVSPINKELTVPTLHSFIIPKDATIDNIKADYSFSEQCFLRLTDRNFPCKPPKGSVAGGFLSMGKYFKYTEAVQLIRHLTVKHNRNIRFGTALEMILFSGQVPDACPDFCAEFGTVYQDKVIARYGDCQEFDIFTLTGEWRPMYRLFIVEDLL